MNYEFLAIAKAGKPIFKDPDLNAKALLEKEGEEIIVSYKSVNRLGKKQRLYNYYHAAILDATIEVLTEEGWEAVDKVKADHYLKANCAKSVMYNSRTDKEEIYLLDKRAMDFDRLYKLVNDCLLLLELRHGRIVQDAEEYKNMKKQDFIQK